VFNCGEFEEPARMWPALAFDQKEKGRTTGPAFSHRDALENEVRQTRLQITGEPVPSQSPELVTRVPSGFPPLLSVATLGSVLPIHSCAMDEHPHRRFFITPIQWLVGWVVVAVMLALAFTAIRAEPRPDRLYEWFFPTNTGSFWAATHPAQAALILAPSSGRNVFTFYRQALHMPRGTGAIFMGRSSGFVFARHFEELGAVTSMRTGQMTNFAGELLFQNKRDQSKLIVCFQGAGEIDTKVWIASIERNASVAIPLSPFLRALEFPGSNRGSGGAMQHGTAFAYSAKTNLAAVEAFYLRNLGTNSSRSSVKANALRAVGDPSARLFRLPGAPAAKTNQIAFLLLTPKTMSLIHAAAISSNETHLMIGTVAR
jgi:hypothetical protein